MTKHIFPTKSVNVLPINILLTYLSPTHTVMSNRGKTWPKYQCQSSHLDCLTYTYAHWCLKSANKWRGQLKENCSSRYCFLSRGQEKRKKFNNKPLNDLLIWHWTSHCNLCKKCKFCNRSKWQKIEHLSLET